MIAAMSMPAVAAAIVADLAARGYAIVPDALPPAAVDALRAHAMARDAAGELAPARVGRGDAAQRAPDRGDRIAWLHDDPASAEAPARALLDALALACNRELYLGVNERELHYAVYPPGAGYARHRDCFRDDDARVVSCVLYLNEAWTPSAGGALRLHVSESSAVDVTPTGGTLVAFLSATFEHEVLPATRERIALTGWLRRRALER